MGLAERHARKKASVLAEHRQQGFNFIIARRSIVAVA